MKGSVMRAVSAVNARQHSFGRKPAMERWDGTRRSRPVPSFKQPSTNCSGTKCSAWIRSMLSRWPNGRTRTPTTSGVVRPSRLGLAGETSHGGITVEKRPTGVPLIRWYGVFVTLPLRVDEVFHGRRLSDRAPIEDAVDDGFTAAKIKIGSSPKADTERVRVAREILGEDARSMVDINGNYRPDQAVRSAAAIKEYDLTWIEEPAPRKIIQGTGSFETKSTFRSRLARHTTGASSLSASSMTVSWISPSRTSLGVEGFRKPAVSPILRRRRTLRSGHISGTARSASPLRSSSLPVSAIIRTPVTFRIR